MQDFWPQYSGRLSQAGYQEAAIVAMTQAEQLALLRNLFESSPDIPGAIGPYANAPPCVSPAQPRSSPRRSQRAGGGSMLQAQRFRRLATIDQSAAAEGVHDPKDLADRWRGIVACLRAYYDHDRRVYAQQIRAGLKDHVPTRGRGITIAVILANGIRITREFFPEGPGMWVYVWCCADEKMLTDDVRAGDFAIVCQNGKALRPMQRICDQIDGDRSILNVRLL